jgi:hypothetical protein
MSPKPLALFLLLITFYFGGASSIYGQSRPEPNKNEKTEESADLSAAEAKLAEPLILIHLVGGGKVEVDEARETSDGVWYKKGGVTTLLDAKRVARIERPSAERPTKISTTQQSNWSISEWDRVDDFFVAKFGRPLPISAFGQSDIHNRWGLDHRQSIDVGLHPDSMEGATLVNFLRSQKIPFLVFYGPVPGVATGPHIHIGRPSHRYLPR